jgi:prepilin-type N-terminal cleavage/methylation domain-containing protein
MKAGFTLVEVMVAVGVSALLIVGVVGVTRSTVEVGERQNADARRDERRSRGIEVLRQDWRERLRLLKPEKDPPAGVQQFSLMTAADGVSGDGSRRACTATITASDRGLYRKEGTSELLLIPGSVTVQFWDGASWNSDVPRQALSLRLLLRDPEETVVVP